MKLRWKILLVILAAVAFHWLEQRLQPCSIATPVASLSTKDLQTAYTAFNEHYFGNQLPKDAEVDYGEYNPAYMGSTNTLPDGRFHIALNELYVSGSRTALLTILHEMCHEKVWNTETDAHGKRWRSCMLGLDAQGAFREQLIDGYREKMP